MSKRDHSKRLPQEKGFGALVHIRSVYLCCQLIRSWSWLVTLEYSGFLPSSLFYKVPVTAGQNSVPRMFSVVDDIHDMPRIRIVLYKVQHRTTLVATRGADDTCDQITYLFPKVFMEHSPHQLLVFQEGCRYSGCSSANSKLSQPVLAHVDVQKFSLLTFEQNATVRLGISSIFKDVPSVLVAKQDWSIHSYNLCKPHFSTILLFCFRRFVLTVIVPSILFILSFCNVFSSSPSTVTYVHACVSR